MLFLNDLIFPHDAAHLDEISNSGRKQTVGTSISDSENLASDENTMEVMGEKYSSSVEVCVCYTDWFNHFVFSQALFSSLQA